jgi:hypothetical protein
MSKNLTIKLRLGWGAEGAAARDRITIYGPKADGTYIVEFKTATGEALAISLRWR